MYSNGFSWLGCDRDEKSTFGDTGGETFKDVRNDLLCYLNDLSEEQEFIASCNDPSDRIIFVNGSTSGSLSFSATSNKYTFEKFSSTNWNVYDYVEFDIKFKDSTILNLNIFGANKTVPIRDYLTGIPVIGEWVHVKIPTEDLIDYPVTKIEFFVPPAAFNDISQVNIELDNAFYLTADNELQYCAAKETGVFRWIDDLDKDDVPAPTKGLSCEANSETFKWTGNMCCGDDLGNESFYADSDSGCWNSLYVEEGGLVNATY